MKHLVLLTALIATAAHAGDVLYAPNQANGAIVLTDDANANCPNGSRAYYTTDASGAVTPTGCWHYANPWVMARGFDGVMHQYSIDQFTMTDYMREHYSGSKHTKSSM